VVSHDHLLRPEDGGHQARKSGSRPKLQYGFALQELIRVVFQILSNDLSSIPQKVTLENISRRSA
jgi:hypothetical protein